MAGQGLVHRPSGTPSLHSSVKSQGRSAKHSSTVDASPNSPPRATLGAHPSLLRVVPAGRRVGEEMPLHDSNVLAMVYSQDLDALITASQDTTIRIHWQNLRLPRLASSSLHPTIAASLTALSVAH